MIIEVELHAFMKGQIRRVTIPEEVWNESDDLDIRLEAVYRFGQNELAMKQDLKQKLSSISVGDVIRTPDIRRFLVKPFGFEEISKDFIPPHDGGLWAYGLGSNRELQC
mgnify:CR=1 FL=1